MDKNLTVTKHNDLIEASYKLSLNEQRLVLVACSKINSFDAVPDSIRITVNDYVEAFGVDVRNAAAQLRSAAKRLYNRDIGINNTSVDEQDRHVRWIQERARYKDGSVEIVWSDRVKEYLGELSGHFTSYKLTQVSGLKSVYTIRLFELLQQFNDSGWRQVELVWLRKYLDLGDSYPRFAQFQQSVLGPAVKELNAKTNLIVEVDRIKTGRQITALKFRFKEDDQLKMDV